MFSHAYHDLCVDPIHPPQQTLRREQRHLFHVVWKNFSDIKNILDVWEIRPFSHRGDFSNKKSQQNTALGKCTQSCKPFLVWTGRKYRCEQFLWRFLWNASMNFTCSVLQQWMVGVQGTWAVGHAVYLSYTQTPVREQNSMGAASRFLLGNTSAQRSCQRNMEVILLLQ